MFVNYISNVMTDLTEVQDIDSLIYTVCEFHVFLPIYTPTKIVKKVFCVQDDSKIIPSTYLHSHTNTVVSQDDLRAQELVY